MNERETLLARAKELEISHPANISNEKLKAKIDEGEAGKDSGNEGAAITPPANGGDIGGEEAQPVSVVTVKGPERGRWRIGRQFTREATVIPLDDLKKGELEALKSDPELIVSLP